MAKDYKVGQMIMNKNRALFAAFFLILAAVALAGARPVAAESLTKPWTQSECKTAKGEWINNDCYAKQVPVNLSVSIGGLNKATLSQYIGAAFNLGVGLAAVFAVIFIMIGGFRYLYAAGGGEVDAAKGMIKNAIIGLVLTSMSYTLLQTVNPALISLELPPVKLVKSAYLSQLKKDSNIQVGGPCYTIQDKEACAQACVKQGLTDASCECKIIDEGMWSTFAKVSTYVAVGAVSGAVGAYKVAGEGLKTVGSAGLNLATRIWQYTKANPFKAASGAVTGGAKMTTAVFLGTLGYDLLPKEPEKGEEGICLPMALATIPPGGVCFDDKNCSLGGTCVSINQNPPYGMCVTGAEGTACSVSGAGNNNANTNCGATGELTCCEVSYGLGTCQKSCTSGKPLESLCQENSECASGRCSMNPEKATKVCVGGTTGAYCGDAEGCNDGWVCKTPFYTRGVSYDLLQYRKYFNTCQTKSRTGEPCCDRSECISDSCNRSATGACQITIMSGQISFGTAGTCN